eukprot:GDKK01038840.1.p1 GENE.GDKK01038840.1~~GDKK01038840.1.p1  ORF type:complete len:115 (-),score=2.21 GDKK01038840.1:8-352(-)
MYFTEQMRNLRSVRLARAIKSRLESIDELLVLGGQVRFVVLLGDLLPLGHFLCVDQQRNHGEKGLAVCSLCVLRLFRVSARNSVIENVAIILANRDFNWCNTNPLAPPGTCKKH